MIERHIRTPRTGRCYATGEVWPDTREVWIACHGYAQLARYFGRPFAAIADAGRVIVAPEALNRYYFESAPGVHGPDARIAATWMTREDRDHEIADYVEYLDNVAVEVTAAAPAAAITALGFSQGAATVSRWAARSALPFRRVILWGSGLPPELTPHPDLFRGAPVIIAAGDSDEHVSLARMAGEQARLAAAGMECRLFEYRGGHGIDADALRELLAVL